MSNTDEANCPHQRTDKGLTPLEATEDHYGCVVQLREEFVDESLGSLVDLADYHRKAGIGGQLFASAPIVKQHSGSGRRGQALVRMAIRKRSHTQGPVALIGNHPAKCVGAYHRNHQGDRGSHDRLVLCGRLERAASRTVGFGDHMVDKAEPAVAMVRLHSYSLLAFEPVPDHRRTLDHSRPDLIIAGRQQDCVPAVLVVAHLRSTGQHTRTVQLITQRMHDGGLAASPNDGHMLVCAQPKRKREVV